MSDQDWGADVAQMRSYMAKQHRITMEIIRAQEVEKRRVMRVLEEKTKNDVRIKAAREEKRRSQLAAKQKAIVDEAKRYGPTSTEYVGGPNPLGLQRRAEDRRDVESST